MRVRVVAVGALKGRGFEEAATEYRKRLRRYCALEEVELPVGKHRDPARRLAQEARALEGALEGGEVRVVCDPGGEALSSEGLAELLDEVAQRGGGRVAFVIGGPEGVPVEVREGARHRVSFSRMVFPHRLFRVMLLEQVYRAFTIQRGEPYHRG